MPIRSLVSVSAGLAFVGVMAVAGNASAQGENGPAKKTPTKDVRSPSTGWAAMNTQSATAPASSSAASLSASSSAGVSTTQQPSTASTTAGAATESSSSSAAATTPTSAPSPDRYGPRAGSHGLSFGLPSGGGGTVGYSYGLSNEASLRLDVGLEIGSNPAGSGAVAGLSVDAGYRLYLWQAGNMHAFVQPSLFLSKPAVDQRIDEVLTVAAVGTVGAEYFFQPQLSVSAATGLSLALSKKFEDVRLRTGTSALFVNFYW